MKHTRISIPLMAAVLAMGGVACDDYPDYVEVSAVTGAPPSRNARVSNWPDHTMDLSVGVALGLRCYDNCDYTCIAPQFIIADPTLIEVKEAYFAGNAGWVVYAKAAGTTTLTVQTTCAEETYEVSVTDDS